MNKILEMVTGYGKSKLALDSLPKREQGQWTLVVVPKIVLIDNWKKEIVKWGYDLKNFDFVCYKSIDKKAYQYWHSIIWDECHHITERVKMYMNILKPLTEHNLFLSATLDENQINWLKQTYNAELISKSFADGVEENRIPEPTIILIPLTLDNKIKHEIYWYSGKWKRYMTEQQFNDTIEQEIAYLKNEYFNKQNSQNKMKWLARCLKRNQELSRFKEKYTLELLRGLKDYRCLTFCCDIDQSKRLGKYNINSKNVKSEELLNLFNDKKIKHITAVDMLSEGCNLSDCQFAIFNYINSSNVKQTQKIGRALRHSNPIIYIPYFTNTREEELVKKMTENFKDVRIVNNIN